MWLVLYSVSLSNNNRKIITIVTSITCFDKMMLIDQIMFSTKFVFIYLTLDFFLYYANEALVLFCK